MAGNDGVTLSRLPVSGVIALALRVSVEGQDAVPRLPNRNDRLYTQDDGRIDVFVPGMSKRVESGERGRR